VGKEENIIIHIQSKHSFSASHQHASNFLIKEE